MNWIVDTSPAALAALAVTGAAAVAAVALTVRRAHRPGPYRCVVNGPPGPLGTPRAVASITGSNPDLVHAAGAAVAGAWGAAGGGGAS